jgi:hypothetical protein
MSSSSSDGGSLEFALLTGDPSANADVIASFRVGDNSMRPNGLPEFTIVDGAGGVNPPAGHITWDAGYDGGEFFSVATVRLQMDQKRIRWSVGTSDFISRPAVPFKRIRKVQVLAAAADEMLDGLIRWDLLQVNFGAGNGIGSIHKSPCLPRASSQVGFRSANSDARSAVGVRQQYAEIIGPCDAVQFELRGQITLQARTAGKAKSLPVDGLQGRVLIFTD